ncbi:receptor-type tyrosine-protein phosphatase S-like isoform X1 [Xenia sp. Carnegie-2017]|uniref:receptor-type tyrosine-protein phosphatase S-like isoform X1 n=1 Tax=Xenia sp. Carnegie-2017 TaxID=2897299 RepID=UPI001F037191|nr:receptor-type tyrosine-protein phosphatase S-like isoform X1 [Xenia sp. Carnegie-2017]
MVYFFNIFAHVLFLVGSFHLITALSCEASRGKLLECGNNVKQQDQCPKTCCFDKTVNPPCYFKERVYGPIQHANGRCINVKDANTLIWSHDCTSRDALFLVSFEYPPYHVATGKCVVPSSFAGIPLASSDPGTNVSLILLTKFCGGKIGRYQPTNNGNLEYYHGKTPYDICIGGSSVLNNKWIPHQNEVVAMVENVCKVDNLCKLHYVYERKFGNKEHLNIQCNKLCPTWFIDVHSAEYGVLMKENGNERKPYKISLDKKKCVSSSALSLVKKRCHGNKECSFEVQKNDFLSTPSQCSTTPFLLVYYTCTTLEKVSIKTPGATISTDESKSNTLASTTTTATTGHKITTEDSKFNNKDGDDPVPTTESTKTYLNATSKKEINSGNVVVLAAAAVGAVLIIFLALLIICFLCKARRKPISRNLYMKPLKCKKNSKDEKHLSLNMNEDVQGNTNVATALSDDLYATPYNADEDCTVTINDLYAVPDKVDEKKIETPFEDFYTKPEKTRQHALEDLYETKPEIYSSVDKHTGVKITRFLMYVEEMKKNESFGFEKDFKELPTGQIHPWDVGKSAKNAKKNKYKNNIAYDHSRVVLSGADSYINANYIQGIQSEIYIAAQGPTSETVNDFWRMIWEQDCTSIICLTKMVEMGKVKCLKYWSDDEITFGEIVVKTSKTEMFADYVIRYLHMEKDGEGKKVTQFHFLSWPDNDAPRYPTKLLVFRQRFRVMHCTDSRPIVVHCSAGVGRTGTFIALDMCLRHVNDLNKQTVDIKETVKKLRNQRSNMVHTLQQYTFLHEAVLEIFLCGVTEVAAQDLRTEIERLEQKELNKSLNGFEIEFNTLCSVCPSFTAEECTTSQLPENLSKNRDINICPAENFRVYLPGRKAGEECYINATYVHGYSKAKAYIATQTPLAHTINDFWKMAFENKTVVIVMLNTINECWESYPQYWPKELNNEQQYGDLFVELVSFESHVPIVLRKLIIRSKTTEKAVVEHVVRHVQFTKWSEHEFPKSYNDVIDLLNTVEEAQQRAPNGVIIVHCSNGAHKTGTYLTLAIQRDRIRTEHVLDIFRCIKVLREERPQFVPDVEHYRFCYYVMLTFIESLMTYDNIPKVQKE